MYSILNEIKFYKLKSDDNINDNNNNNDNNSISKQQNQQITSLETHWVLWGMTFGIVSNLFQIVNYNKPFFQHKLPFWFDNKLVNVSIKFWKYVLGGATISRASLISISVTSIFGITGLSLYGLGVAAL